MAIPRLVDAYGHPIDVSMLKEEQAGPTLTGIRQIYSGHPAQGLTPARLAGLLLTSEHGDPYHYLELAEEMEEKDLHYLSVLGTRKRAVAQLEITVEDASDSPEDVKAGDLLREWLRREDAEQEIFDILDAIGKGFSVVEILWDTSATQWWPQRLEWRDPRWFRFDWVDGNTLLLRDNEGYIPLVPFKFIQHKVRAKSGLPIRGGLARAAAWAYLFKNYDIKDWVTFAEVHGQPLRVGKYHPGATEPEKDTLLRAVANIGSDAAAIIPQSMLIEFVDSANKSQSADLYEKFADWLDRQVSKAVLGQTQTTEITPGSGSKASAQVHEDVRRDIMRSDAKQLGATLNRDLVRPFIDLNLGPQKKYPRILIGVAARVDLKEFSDAIGELVDRGLLVEQSVVLDRIGLPQPEQGAAVLHPSNSTPAGTPAVQSSAGVGAQPTATNPTDSIDDLVDGDLGDWERVMKPLIDPIEKLCEDAETLEEVRDRLADAIHEMDTKTFQNLLARAGFAARLAGDVEAPISDETDTAVASSSVRNEQVHITVNVPKQEAPVVNVHPPQVHIEVQPADVHVQAALTRQPSVKTIERDAEGRIKKVREE